MGNVKRTAFALATLGVTSVLLAQETGPAREPPTSTAPPEHTAPPATSSARRSESDTQTLMKDCIGQVRAANPSEPESEIREYCDKQVKSYSPH